MRLLAAAGADDLRGQGLMDEFLAKSQKRLQPLGLLGIFFQPHLLHAQTLDFRLQVTVLLAHPMQINIVVPGVAEEMSGTDKRPLKGSDGIDRPDANEERSP